MLSSCCLDPDANALLNEATLGWTPTGAPNAGLNYQDEQGYELVPNGNVLTIDIWSNYPSGNAKMLAPTVESGRLMSGRSASHIRDFQRSKSIPTSLRCRVHDTFEN